MRWLFRLGVVAVVFLVVSEVGLWLRWVLIYL